MEERLRVQRLRAAQNDVLWGAWSPPTECDFEGTNSKISVKGPEFLATALSAIMVSRPSTVYHLVFTPILPFPYCNLTEEFFSTWRWSVHNRHPHKQVTLLQAIDGAYNDQCQACICHARRFFFFTRCLTNENIHCDVDENLWPNPQDRVDKNIEEQWGTLQLTFYCRPNVVFS